MKQHLIAASFSRRAAPSSSSLRRLVLSCLAGGLTLLACTTKNVVATPAPAPDGGAPGEVATCDESKCATKNKCLADADGVVACRLPCAAHTDCPFNTACKASDPASYCVKTNLEISKKPTGQWGTPCMPGDGLTGNPACDAETEFYCYGTGTTDANAYCTHYDCETDLDCAGGFYCGTVNRAPSVTTDTRSFGAAKTRKVCLKHDYCAPCVADFDCPILDGKPSICVDDVNGGRFCTIKCATTSNCQLDAACNGVTAEGEHFCRPRAGACVGDGTLCSPCRSDADCPDGFCIRGMYSPERFCSVKSKTTCAASGGTASLVKGDCPAFAAVPTTQIGCQSSTSDAAIPKDQCIGIIDWGDTGDIGCYTKH